MEQEAVALVVIMMRCARLFLLLLLTSCATGRESYARAEAIKAINNSVKVGQTERSAVTTLTRLGFRCRQLEPTEYASFDPKVVKAVSCFIEADRTKDGYSLVYASLSVGRNGTLVGAHADFYPVLYRNLRVDAQGRTIVVQDDPRPN